MATEADTCRMLITPALQAAGWEAEPHSIAEQRTFTDGRIVVHGMRATRRKGRRADYILRYTRDFPIAVVEAKPEDDRADTGFQQAKEYAEILGLKFAFATNGRDILEHDYLTGLDRRLERFPTPAELWARLRSAERLPDDSAAQRLLTPANLTTGKDPRYYQQIAINAAVQAILQGKRRVLLTMATGTGKTVVAFQICWKLWSSRWNRTCLPLAPAGPEEQRAGAQTGAGAPPATGDPRRDDTRPSFPPLPGERAGVREDPRTQFPEFRKPRILYLADRNFLVDECHRGSAKEDSNWREILDYFEPAYQLGMTATPLRQDNRDTYLYFGNPVYTYSLKQGIDDGFLTPYRVHRVVTQWDAAGWRPSREDLDRYGRRIPDEECRVTRQQLHAKVTALSRRSGVPFRREGGRRFRSTERWEKLRKCSAVRTNCALR